MTPAARRAAPFVALVALAQCKRVPEPAPNRSAEGVPDAAHASATIVNAATSTSSTAAPLEPTLLPRPGSSARPATAEAHPNDLQLFPKPEAAAVRFAVVGDYGSGTPPEAQVASLVKSWNPDFVITLGDNNYPAGEATTIDAHIGRYYSDFIGNYRGRFGPGSKINRFWPSPGNHDWLSGLIPYMDYFTLPGNERYYDVDLGLVHLFALDSDVREPDGITAESRQAMWLKEHMTSSKACFDIVYFHHPAYSTAAHGPTREMRWPFRAWGAEAVFAGHDHTYERFQVDGIPYFVNGLGGEAAYDFAGGPVPETRFRYNELHGAMRVTATPTGITYEFVSIDGQKRDTFTAAASCTR